MYPRCPLLRASRIETASLQRRDLLIRNELLSSDQVEIFEELRRLRNEAVHVAEAEFTPEAVSNYLSASLKMASYLRQRPGGI